jgi:serine/threonine protein kinase
VELAPGTEVDRYVVEELLGRGGMATVYRVRHRELGGVFALKVLDVPSRSVRERLRAEGSFQSRLRHPNVVSVLDVVALDGAPALLLEYVDGPTLEGLLRVHRPTLAQIDDLARGILLGVRAAHRHGLVHRDLKPANVLLQRSEDGFVPKITDFGLARALEGDGGSVGQTRSGAMLGTPAYMAPEQFQSSHVDVRADVYSLGVTLYELCTGERPYDAKDLFGLADQVRSGRYTPPRSLVPELPERMEAAIAGALKVDPADRFPDVDAMRAAWTGRADLADDRSSAWDRALLDSMSRSSSSTSGSGSAASGGRDSAPQTWVGASAASIVPAQRPASFARRSAPFVAVAGLALVMLLGVGVVGGGAGALVLTRSSTVGPPAAEAPAVSAPAAAPDAPRPAPAGPPAEPAAREEAKSTPRVSVTGDAQVVLRDAAGATVAVEEAVPGAYTGFVFWPHGEVGQFAVEVPPSGEIVIHCSSMRRHCVVRPR